MRLQYAILVMMMLSSSHQHEVVKRESGGEKRIVCYYTNWSVYRPGTAKFNPQNINPYLCTHLIYAFGGLDRENGLRPYDKYQDIEQGGYAKFTGLKTYNKALKTMLAIGGWNEGSTRFSPLVADEGRRKEFVKNVVKFLRINHFDGLDLDWEYPAYRDGGKHEDKQNYAQLVQELREEFDRESDKTGRPRLLLTMAVPAGIEYIDKGYDIPKLNKYLDFMNILSYDYHSAFEPSVNHHSPLYSLEEEGEYNFDSQLTIDATVKHYLLKGADPGKLVLGIPTYGRSYTLLNEESTDMGSPTDGPGQQGDATREKGYLAYYEICNNVNDGGWTVVQPKETAMGPYAFKGNQWVGYDDEQIARKKSKYVNERNLGGIMFWSIDNDDFRGKCHSRPYPLIEAAKESLIERSPFPSNKLPNSPRGGKTATSKLSSKLKNHRIPSTTSSTTTTAASLTTPDPPTTPDPGSDFVCKDEGFFPHPRDCKKYFWCLDSGPSNLGIVAHQFTCPSGLFFNKAADSCDFSRNVICKKKSSETATTTTTTTTAAPSSLAKTTSLKYQTTTTKMTTTTTTTTPEPLEDEEEYYEEEQEDPQTIKQLITLIKKLGGVAELEKQLENNTNGGTDSTTPAISKSLYHRVINKQTSRFPNLQRNGPTGPQNEGIVRERSNFRKDKPSYVTIRRERPTTDKSTAALEYEDDEEEVDEDQEPKERPQYVPIQRNRGSQTEGIKEVGISTERAKLKYQSVDRFRTKVKDNEKTADETREGNTEEGSPSFVVNDLRPATSTLRYTNILRNRITDTSTSTTSRYVTLRRQRPQQSEVDDSGTTEVELDEDENIDDIPVTATTTSTTTTTRPRVKVSEEEASFTTTPQGVQTSTRVVTQVVEGATKRQKVPLHALQQFLKDADNLIDSVTHPYSRGTFDEEQTNVDIEPNKVGFHTRRPIIVTTTLRSTPSYIALRRNRVRTTTEAVIEANTKHKGFVPNRLRGRVTTESIRKPDQNVGSEESDKAADISNETETTTHKRFFSRPRSTTTSQPSHSTLRTNRFGVRRTTSQPNDEDKFFTREYSRDSNVIRRPLTKPRFPSRRLPTTQNATESPPIVTSTTVLAMESISALSNSSLNSSKEIVDITTEIPTTLIELKTTLVIDEPSEDASTITQYSATTPSQSMPLNPQSTTPLSVQSKVPLNHKLVTPSSQQSTTSENLKIKSSSEQAVRNKTKIILRKRKPVLNHIVEISNTNKPVREKIIIRRKKPLLNNETEANEPVLNEGPSSTFAPIKRRGTAKFAEIVDEELENISSRGAVRSSVARTRNLSTSSRQSEDHSDNPTTRNPIARQLSRRRQNVNEAELSNSTSTRGSTFESRRRNDISKRRLTTNIESPQQTIKVNNDSGKRNFNGRGQQKFHVDHINNDNRPSNINELNSQNVLRPKTKIRRVVHKKPLRDLAVGESGIPEQETYYNSLDDLPTIQTTYESLNDEDLDFIDEHRLSGFEGDIEVQPTAPFEAIQNRGRRPYHRRPAGRSTTSTTTSTTPEPTTQQQSTVQILKRRLNRFKYDRGLQSREPVSSTESIIPDEEAPTTVRTRKGEFRRVIRPVQKASPQSLDSSIEQSVAKDTVSKMKQFHRETFFKPQGQSISITERPLKITPSPDYLGTINDYGETSNIYDESNQDTAVEERQSSRIEDDERIPDLANVAVAAIQSLATSVPTHPTEQYAITPTFRTTTELPRLRSSRPRLTTPPSTTVSTSQQIRTISRSSPRPFSKTVHRPQPSSSDHSQLQPRGNRPIDDYEDYYAEPVDVPLSGKVRIHNDGYIECLDIGNFPHPFSCRKFISCAKMEIGHLLGWEYTCPKGLSFDPIGGICNWNAGLGCKD